jgi:deazaflavin-dependent oxidoreductase (nitroreductase family)
MLMTEITSDSIRPPKGFLLLGFRLPVWLYRWGLGGLMGKRAIYFEHKGRISGALRRTVVEIIRYDPEADCYYIVSGYGEKADWYKNILKRPRIKAQVGGRRFDAIAERLSQERALAEFQDYTRRYPNALKYLGRLLGLQIKGTEEELVSLSQILPVMAIKVE